MAKRTLPILKQLLHQRSPPLSRSVTYMPRPGDGAPRTVTLIPGDGIGPLVTGAVEQVMDAMHAPIYFEKFEVHGDMKTFPPEVVESIKKNKVCLKGGLNTPMGGGVSSLNVQLRKELDLYASLVNCFNLPGLPTRHENVDIVVIRENTEGSMLGLNMRLFLVWWKVLRNWGVQYGDHKVLFRAYCEICLEYAYLNNRKTVTAVHKANIMKLADGLFLESCREIASKYPSIKYNEIIVDNCCMQLVSKPEQFDVMVTPNLYGNLVANTAAGIAGGTGVMPGDKIGKLLNYPSVQVTWGGSCRFRARCISRKCWKTENSRSKDGKSSGSALSSAMMLRHLQFPSFADRLETAVKRVISEGKTRTKDLGGKSTTQEVVDAVIANLE
ncbi:hypothetical protein OSB04_014309 [Centaurea solstitialis]|uniref:Isopropylmalate dehydrogenase-like domain-containing protein n=1 Tax=Centaurea solstitialis TaxID=347529 RepID=A0AA38WHL9_9ASTR|nr:hypothetical protein OSB04_014309 [Centaurea solstitialis]